LNHVKKLIYNIMASFYKNLKKNYRIHRKILNLLNPHFRPLYHFFDHKIMVGNREIPLRMFYPKTNESHGTMIFFHGGGWVTGNIDSYTHVCANMANQTGHGIISVDYQLAPENPFPLGVEDCYFAARELFLNYHLLNCNPEDITLIGDSAGGNLAAAVSLMARDRGEFLPSRQILIYPSTYNDHSENSPFSSIRENGTDYILTSKRIQDYMDLYIKNKEDIYNPYFAPLLAEDLSEQPKTLVITAEFDPLRDEGEAFGVRLKEFGNFVEIFRIKNALHGFLTLPWTSEYVVKCYEVINCFLNEKVREMGSEHEPS